MTRRMPFVLLILAVIAPVLLMWPLPPQQPTTPPFMAIPAPSTTPAPPAYEPCLKKQFDPFFHAHLPVNPGKAGPGSGYKASAPDFGASAVPVNFDSLSKEQALAAVKKTFIDAHCGSLELQRGGDPTLLEVGKLATNPSFNTSDTFLDDWDGWSDELEAYLSSIFWEKSRIEVTTLPKDMWTLSMSARGPPSVEPFIYAQQHDQPRSHYLVLVIEREDGTFIEDWRRLECYFQPAYLNVGEVPFSVRPGGGVV